MDRWSALALALAILGAVALSVVHSLQVFSYHLMTDELAWSRLALSVAEGGTPSIRGELPNPGVLYAYLTAPAYLLIEDMQDALSAARVLGGVFMASTAIPVYLLARQLRLESWVAVLIATLSVFVPWLALSAMLMSETVAYPAFAWAVLAIHHALIRPGARGDLLALTAIGLSFLARPQLGILIGVFVAAVVVHELGMHRPGVRSGPSTWLRSAGHGLRAAADGHRFLAAVVVAGGLFVLIGASTPLLGSYAATLEGDLFPPGTYSTGFALLAIVAVAIGVFPLPLALAWGLAVLGGRTDLRRHAFAAILLVSLPVLIVQVASFIVRFGIGGLQDRYLFYLVPVLLVGMALWFAEPRRSWVLSLGAAAGMAWVLAQVPWKFVGHPDPSLNIAISPGTWSHKVIDGRTQQLLGELGISGLSTLTVLQAVTVGGILVLLLLKSRGYGRPALIGVGSALMTVGVLQAGYVMNGAVERQYQGIGAPNPPEWITNTHEGTWIDPQVPDDARVGLVPWRLINYGTVQDPWWDSELRNRSVHTSYVAREEEPPTTFRNETIEIDPETGSIELSEPATHLVLSTEFDVELRGSTLATSPSGYLELIELDPAMQADGRLSGFSPDLRTTDDAEAVIRVFGSDRSKPTRRLLKVRFDVPVGAGAEKRTYRLVAPRSTSSGAIDEGVERAKSLELCVPANGHSNVRVSTLDSEGEEQGLGIRVLEVEVQDRPGRCQPHE